MDIDAEVLARLRRGELAVQGRLVDSSNNALVVTVGSDSGALTAVYKPLAGERPLWDFPQGTLSRREVAAYELARLLQWPIVPPTLWREDCPAGPGMLQLWVDSADPTSLIDVFAPDAVPLGWRPIVQGFDQHQRQVVLAHADDPQLRRLALFDVIANNADRKGGHILVDPVGTRNGRNGVVGIDHGVTFHVEQKLRTVLWGFAGEPLGQDHVEQLERLLSLQSQLAAALLLSKAELRATVERVRVLLQVGQFPSPDDSRPMIPWPIF